MEEPNIHAADTFTPEHLSPWSPDGPTAFDSAANYCGGDFSEFYLAPIGRNRDTCDSITLSNWEVISEELDRLSEHDETGSHIFNHWACGWYEIYLIHRDDEPALRCADRWAAALADYPVADESALSELEYEQELEDYDTWARSDWERQLIDALTEYLPDDADPDTEDIVCNLSTEKKDALFWEILSTLPWSTEHLNDGTRFNMEGARDALTLADLRELTGLALLPPDQEWRREPYPWPDGSTDPLAPPLGRADG